MHYSFLFVTFARFLADPARAQVAVSQSALPGLHQTSDGKSSASRPVRSQASASYWVCWLYMVVCDHLKATAWIPI